MKENPLKGRKRPQEVIDKISATKQRKMAEGFVVVGHTTTQATKDKISEKLKGRVFTDQWRENISRALKGRPSPKKGITTKVAKVAKPKQPKPVKIKIERPKIAKPKAVRQPKPKVERVKIAKPPRKKYIGRLAMIHGWGDEW